MSLLKVLWCIVHSVAAENGVFNVNALSPLHFFLTNKTFGCSHFSVNYLDHNYKHKRFYHICAVEDGFPEYKLKVSIYCSPPKYPVGIFYILLCIIIFFTVASTHKLPYKILIWSLSYKVWRLLNYYLITI